MNVAARFTSAYVRARSRLYRLSVVVALASLATGCDAFESESPLEGVWELRDTANTWVQYIGFDDTHMTVYGFEEQAGDATAGCYRAVRQRLWHVEDDRYYVGENPDDGYGLLIRVDGDVMETGEIYRNGRVGTTGFLDRSDLEARDLRPTCGF